MTLADRITDMERRVLNAATVEAAAHFHEELDRLRAQQAVTDPGSDYRKGYQAGYKAGRSAAGLDVERLARAMHPTLFEDLSTVVALDTMTPTEWGRLVGDVHRRRWAAMREAKVIAAEYVRAATRPAEEGEK